MKYPLVVHRVPNLVISLDEEDLGIGVWRMLKAQSLSAQRIILSPEFESPPYV